MTGGHFPLGEALLQHLRRIDFRKGGNEQQAAEVKLHQERKEITEQKERQNTSDALGREYFPFMFQIPQVGYTGHTKIVHRSDL